MAVASSRVPTKHNPVRQSGRDMDAFGQQIYDFHRDLLGEYRAADTSGIIVGGLIGYIGVDTDGVK